MKKKNDNYVKNKNVNASEQDVGIQHHSDLEILPESNSICSSKSNASYTHKSSSTMGSSASSHKFDNDAKAGEVQTKISSSDDDFNDNSKQQLDHKHGKNVVDINGEEKNASEKYTSALWDFAMSKEEFKF